LNADSYAENNWLPKMQRNMTIDTSSVLCKAVSSGSELLCVLLDQAMKQQLNQIASCIIKPAYGHLVTKQEMVKLENAVEMKGVCDYLEPVDS